MRRVISVVRHWGGTYISNSLVSKPPYGQTYECPLSRSGPRALSQAVRRCAGSCSRGEGLAHTVGGGGVGRSC